MRIDVGYTLEEFEEGNTFLLLNTTLNRRVCYYLIKFGYPVLGLVFLGLAIFFWMSDRVFTTPVVTNLVFALLMVFARYRFSAAIRKSYKLQQRSLQSVLTIDETGIGAVRKDGSATAHFMWSAVDKWAERSTAMFLVVGPSSYVRVPSGQMSPEEREQVRGWLAGVPKVK